MLICYVPPLLFCSLPHHQSHFHFLLCFLLKLGINNWLFGQYSCLESESIYLETWIILTELDIVTGKLLDQVIGITSRKAKRYDSNMKWLSMFSVLHVWSWWCYWHVIEQCVQSSSIICLLISSFPNGQRWGGSRPTMKCFWKTHIISVLFYTHSSAYMKWGELSPLLYSSLVKIIYF